MEFCRPCSAHMRGMTNTCISFLSPAAVLHMLNNVKC